MYKYTKRKNPSMYRFLLCECNTQLPIVQLPALAEIVKQYSTVKDNTRYLLILDAVNTSRISDNGTMVSIEMITQIPKKRLLSLCDEAIATFIYEAHCERWGMEAGIPKETTAKISFFMLMKHIFKTAEYTPLCIDEN